MLPPVIVLECDHGAEWPTWTPARRHRRSGHTRYVPFEDVAISPTLRARLLAWQRWWEASFDTAGDDDPDDGPAADEPTDDEVEWARFVTEGRSLARSLQRELGGTIEVRLGYDA